MVSLFLFALAAGIVTMLPEVLTRHEMGHARVAERLTMGDVEIEIACPARRSASARQLQRLHRRHRVTRTTIYTSRAPWRRFGGYCAHDPITDPTELRELYDAGPRASGEVVRRFAVAPILGLALALVFRRTWEMVGLGGLICGAWSAYAVNVLSNGIIRLGPNWPGVHEGTDAHVIRQIDLGIKPERGMTAADLRARRSR